MATNKDCKQLCVRHCCQLPCFLSLLPLLRHFCTHCNYTLSIAAAELPICLIIITIIVIIVIVYIIFIIHIVIDTSLQDGCAY